MLTHSKVVVAALLGVVLGAMPACSEEKKADAPADQQGMSGMSDQQGMGGMGGMSGQQGMGGMSGMSGQQGMSGQKPQ